MHKSAKGEPTFNRTEFENKVLIPAIEDINAHSKFFVFLPIEDENGNPITKKVKRTRKLEDGTNEIYYETVPVYYKKVKGKGKTKIDYYEFNIGVDLDLLNFKNRQYTNFEALPEIDTEEEEYQKYLYGNQLNSMFFA